ncbi:MULTISPECIES: DNA-binding protein [Methylobacteriaceae]|uniref:Integrase n=2 Tax=Methylobacteriaceae TaxID=119045 RepID=A0A169QL31_9HYPH|nr:MULTISPECIES: DNA-binding protein [Methylobacteriaceae]MDV2984018.1 DNA-binding protein [Methylobacteriaceae bacterium AG10]RUP02561.1 MAG: hypothetical protein EKK34_23535 [Mycobacterium sp.]MBY0252468.1 DNA-binding protein [Methylobacterium organophilum]BAU89064.1 integrase [Methylorubrum populi]GJE28769.1 hypothetical protein LKMONMHP_3643 [Methylobacterium organophilum]
MITEAEVHHACDVLDGRGEEPKYEAIRAELGNRGSWSTIKRYRQSWIAREQEVPPVPEELNAHVTAVATAVWRTAYPLASGTFGDERQAAAAEIGELTAALAHVEAELAARDVALAQLTERAADLERRLAAAEAARQEEAAHRARLSGEVSALAGVNRDLRGLLGSRPEPVAGLRVIEGEAGRGERAS